MRSPASRFRWWDIGGRALGVVPPAIAAVARPWGTSMGDDYGEGGSGGIEGGGGLQGDGEGGMGHGTTTAATTPPPVTLLFLSRLQ
jgi:hypothetical protein